MTRIKIDMRSIEALNLRRDVGILATQRILWKKEARRRIEEARNVEDLKDVLLDLVGEDE